MRRNGQFQPEGVGLYRSEDGGDHWTMIDRSNPLLWPKDFTLDPKSSKVIYLSGCSNNVRPEGGLYRPPMAAHRGLSSRRKDRSTSAPTCIQNGRAGST